MRQANKLQLASLPVEVLVCLALTPVAWIIYLASQIMADGTISLVQLGMAGLCSLVVFGLKGWGRWLCVVYDLLLVGLLAYQANTGTGGVPIPLFQAVAFALAGAALFWPATTRAFRLARQEAPAEPVSPKA